MIVMNWFLTSQGPATVSSLQAAFLLCWQMQPWRQICKTALYRPGHLRQGLFMSLHQVLYRVAYPASEAMDSAWDSGWANKTCQIQAHQKLGFFALLSSALPVLTPQLWQNSTQIHLGQTGPHSASWGFPPPWTMNKARYTQYISGTHSGFDKSSISPHLFFSFFHALWFPHCLQYLKGMVKM